MDKGSIRSAKAVVPEEIRMRAGEHNGTRVRLPKAAELVAQNLRGRIVRGELKEGETLDQEAKLLEQFGVSRPTLREAIRILESEGLISVSRGMRGGAIVHRPQQRIAARHFGFVLQSNGASFADLFKARILIEPAAVREVTERRSIVAVPILKEIVERIQLGISDDREFASGSAEFHRVLIEMAGIETLTLMMGVINEILPCYITHVAVSSGETIDNMPGKIRAQKAKQKLIRLITSRDGAAAESFWCEHLTAAERVMRRWGLGLTTIDFVD